MKKSFMSISMLVVTISMLAMFVCSAAASAKTTSSTKFIYNKMKNAEVVYTLDPSGQYLTPKLKYEFTKNEAGTIKTAYRWNTEDKTWAPYYRMTKIEKGNNSIVEYAVWNNQTKDFSLNAQKAVYNKGVNSDVLSYIFYKWNPSEKSWEMSQSLLLEDYLAMNADSLK